MEERKAFFANPKCQYHVSQWREHDYSAHKKSMEIITSIQVFLITSKMVERKTFLGNTKHQYPLYQCGEHDCSTNNKKNGNY